MHTIGTIVIGLIIGLVGRLLLPGRDKAGFIATIIISVTGSFLGTSVGQLLGWYQPGEAAGFLMSVAGAMTLLVLARNFFKNR